MKQSLKIKRRIQYFLAGDHDWIIEHCYIDMYSHSTPKGDFKELVKNATINERGEKEIPFDDYLMKKAEYDEILEFYKSFLIYNFEKRKLRYQINLGCSPRHD